MEKEEEEHYYRLICLVVDIGTEVMLNLFKKYIPPSQTLEAFLNSKMHIIYPPKGRKVLTESQYKALTAVPIDMSKFDITLLCVLIRNLTNIQAPNGGWDTKTLSATDTSPGALIINLRGIRNTVAHRSKGKLTKSEFEKYWRETEGILVDLSDHAEKAAVKKKIEHAKIKQLVEDPKVKENELAVGKLQEGYSDLAATFDQNKQKVDQRLDHVSADMEQLRFEDQKIESSLQEHKTEVQNQFEKVEQRQDDVFASVQINKSSLQELGTDVQKVDQRLVHVSAAVHKNESSLQELGTDIQKVDQRQDHLSTTFQELQTDVQKVMRMKETPRKSCPMLCISSLCCGKFFSPVSPEEMDQQLGHVSAAVQELGTNIQKSEQHGKASLGPEDQAYNEIKQNLRKEIIDHYRRINCCKTAIPALVEGRKTDVNEVFVMPTMRVVEPGTSTSLPNKDTGKQPKYITRIHEMFLSEGEAIGKVYLRGEAGTGKTTLCQKIVSLWCNVHTGQQTENKTDEEKFLKDIELLFYIPLRNHITSDIIEMIKTEVVRKRHYNGLDLVLENESENCLIILDGLDEWTPSPDCRHKVPYIDPKEKFKVLTTSRPWKLEVLRPEMCDLGQIELCELDQNGLIKAVVNLLNSRSGKTVDWKCFKYTDETVTLWHKVKKETYKKIQHLADVPVILTAMVCMWHDGEEIGTTRIQAYGKMVEYLMNVAVKRNPMMGEPSTMMEPQKSTATEKIDVFKGYLCCEMHSNTLFKLSDLAYHTLFNPKKENSLVFHHKDTEMYNLTEGDVKFCLNIGLLSQSEFYGKAASDMKCISFLHKTLQEFFAAIFIAHGGKELLLPMKTLNDVFEMAEVLRFVSGLRPDLIGEISHHIAELTDRDDRILKYRNSLPRQMLMLSQKDYRDIVRRVQTIIYDCIVEVPTDRKLGCKVELYDVIHVNWDKSSIDTILPYLNTEHIKSLWTEKNVYNWLDRVGHNLVKLWVELKSAEDMQRVVSVIDRCSSCLSVVGIDNHWLPVSSVSVDNIITSLYRISHLTCFRLESMNLTHSGIEDLVRFLSTSTQLREIEVINISCTTCEQCEYTVDLSHHIYLQYLHIVGLDGDFVLSSDTPLEHCIIMNVKCGPSIVNRLRSSTTLQELLVNDRWCFTGTTDSTTVNTHNQGVVHPPPACWSTVLTQVIPTLMNLRELVLYYIDFKQDILRLSPGMTSLEYVWLFYTTMTLQCVQGFIDSLPQTECEVVMDEVTIRPTGDLSTAVKYITDRHPGTKPWSAQNIIEDDEINLRFTNRPSHSEDDNDDDDDDDPEGLNDDLDDDDDDDDLEEEEEEDDKEESNLGLLQQTGDLEDEEDDEDYEGYEDEQAEVVQEEGRPTARPCVIHESSQQELGTGVQKVDQRLGHVSAAVQKNESSLQELGTDVRKVDQGHDHLSAALQKNESSLQKVEQRQDHLSAAVQKNESSQQKPPAITILYDRQEENRKKRKGEELDETVRSQPSNKWFKSSNTAESGIHTETKQPETSDLETDK